MTPVLIKYGVYILVRQQPNIWYEVGGSGCSARGDMASERYEEQGSPWVTQNLWCFQNGSCGYGYGIAFWHTTAHHIPVPWYDKYTEAEFLFIIFISTYLLF